PGSPRLARFARSIKVASCTATRARLQGALNFSVPMGSAVKHKVVEDHTKAPINQKLTPEEKLKLLREMIRVRRFEMEALRQYNGGKIGGFLHLYNGQESIAVGACSLMGDDDHVITAYRDHGHALAVGMTMNECMAELFGKATGCSKGKGGSM